MVAGSVTTEEDPARGFVLRAGGRWDVQNLAPLDTALRQLQAAAGRRVTFDLAAVERLDTAGAWLIYRSMRALRAAGAPADIENAPPEMRALLAEVAASDRPGIPAPRRRSTLLAVIGRVGKGTVEAVREAWRIVGFFGLLCATFIGTLMRPWRLRVTPLVHHIEQVGLNALPIVGLISFLIGMVLAYQGAVQLQKFGAEIFVVDLIGIAALRETGILLTAVVVAGRSGSAFAAQIGSMMVHEEVDAMRTLGLDPMEVLVLPRVLALIVALPILALFADLMALLGGGVVGWAVLDIQPQLFLQRLSDAVTLWTLGVGLIKAPVFGLLIGMVGCLEGMRVSGSAESVGYRTTRAVVSAIFLVIVVDALFSIFFSVVGV